MSTARRQICKSDLINLTEIDFVEQGTFGIHLIRPVVKLSDGTWLIGKFDHRANFMKTGCFSEPLDLRFSRQIRIALFVFQCQSA